MTNKEAIEILKEEWRINAELFGKQFDEALDLAIKALEEQKRPKGVWLESNKGAFGFQDFACSNCHTEIKDMPTAMTTPIYNYCPTCGAKMKEEEND